MKSQIKLKNLLLFLILISGIDAYAQPCFVVGGSGLRRGCAPFTIALDTTCSDGVTSILFDYNYDGSYDPNNTSSLPSGLSSSITHTYTEPGIYGIAMVGNFNGSGAGIGFTNWIEVLPTPPPVFNIQTCANREVQLTIVDNAYERYEVNWGNGITQNVAAGSIPLTHFYAASTNYAITVTGIYDPGACGASLVQQVTPLSGIPPIEIQEVKVISKRDIDVTFQTDNNFLYQTEYRTTLETNYSALSSSQGNGSAITQSISDLNTENQDYIIRVRAFDVCGNEILSDSIYTIRTEAEAQDGQNFITWEQYAGTKFQQYTLLRNESPIATFDNLSSVSYTDLNVFCKEVYCYRIVVETGTTILTNSISDSSCVIAFTTNIPASLTNVQPTIEDNKQVIITWENADTIAVTSYNIIRTALDIESGLTEKIDTFSVRDDVPQLLDANVSLGDGETQYCYTISYTNFCDNTAPSTKIICPVFIRVFEKQQDNLLLTWSTYESDPNGSFAYILEKLDENLQVYEQIPIAGLSQSYVDENISQDRQVLRYRIRTIVDLGTGIFESLSNVLTFEQPFELFFPNAFTPNDDGLNDSFFPKGLFIKSINLVVYNREGQVLFSTNNIDEGWDGNHNGTPAPMDTYIYAVESEDFNGNSFARTGTFTLIR